MTAIWMGFFTALFPDFRPLYPRRRRNSIAARAAMPIAPFTSC
jgi:hypothetical protein